MGASGKQFLEYRTLEQQQQLLRDSTIIKRHYGEDHSSFNDSVILAEPWTHADFKAESDLRNKDEQPSNRFPCTDEQPEGYCNQRLH